MARNCNLFSHHLRAADLTAAMAILKTVAPDAKVSFDTPNRLLVAIASPEDHQAIKEAIEKLQPGDLGPDAPILRFYPLAQPLPPTALALFTKLTPKATVTPDPDGKWLQVVATAAGPRITEIDTRGFGEGSAGSRETTDGDLSGDTGAKDTVQ